MIERVHLLKLKPEHATEHVRQQIVEHALAALAGVPGVQGVTAGAPADPETGKSWDLVIVVRFSALSDVEAYRAHPEHRRFADELLAPVVDVKKAWNFDCLTTGPGAKLEPM